MAEIDTMIVLKVEPRSAEIGRRLCLSWTGNVAEGHWIGLFPSGSIKPQLTCKHSTNNTCRKMFNLLTPCRLCSYNDYIINALGITVQIERM